MERMLERNEWCQAIEDHARRRNLPNIRCFIVAVDGSKEYAICDEQEWLYGNTNVEAIATHIDMIYLTKGKMK